MSCGKGSLVFGEALAEPEAPAVGDKAGAHIDLSQITSPAWRAAIDKATSYPPLAAGHGQITLLRVMLEDETHATPKQPEKPAQPVVNGVRLFIPGLTIELSASFAAGNPQQPIVGPAATVQLSSVKLLGFTDFPNGGGRYHETHHEGFVIVEHINSTARQGDKDPVEIGAFNHGSTKIWAPVPPRGDLGIFGDVVLQRTPERRLGRIVAEIVAPAKSLLKLGVLQVGPVVVGGSYGRSYEFSEQGITGSDRLSPGSYKIVLPAFDIAKSRWDLTVEPGKVTYLRFSADSRREIRLDGTQIVDIPGGEGRLALER